jgi:hypothetical protein
MEQRDRRGDQEYLENDENFKSGGEIEVSDPWGVESTQKSNDSMEKSRNRQWEDLGRPNSVS